MEQGSQVKSKQADERELVNWRATSSSLFENEALGYSEPAAGNNAVGVVLLPRGVCLTPPFWESKSQEEEKKWSGV